MYALGGLFDEKAMMSGNRGIANSLSPSREVYRVVGRVAFWSV